MQTQTHVLLACAVLVPGASAYLVSTQSASTRLPGSTTSRFAVWAVAVAAIVGAVLPDASLFLMWGVAKLQGVPEAVVWRDWYYSPQWQQIGAISNSIPVFLGLAALAWLAGARFRPLPAWRSRALQLTVPELPQLLLVAMCAALLHAITDLPLHHDDGHPHFWPISNWIYQSPVSYWDPAHYGETWSLIESLASFGLLLLLWTRYKSAAARIVLALVSLSYVLAAVYWSTAF